MTSQPQAPTGINHLVLHVNDMDESHRFWTDGLGFRHVATSRRPETGANGEPRPPMRFYSGEQDGRLSHHDIALIEQPLSSGPPHALHHIAVAYPTEAAWEARIAHLTAHGAHVYRQIDRGVTRSIHVNDPNGYMIELVYELPRAAWENDIEGALDRAIPRS